MTERPPVGTRADYKHWQAMPTRWMDNDIYGHMNNATYYSFFDTVINNHLIANGLDINDGAIIGLAIETGCRFHAELGYPGTIDAGLRVGHLGNSSVRYEVGLFAEGADTASAEGHFVHVFVDRPSKRPTPIPLNLRACLEALQ